MSELKKMKRYRIGSDEPAGYINYAMNETSKGSLVYDPDHAVDDLLEACKWLLGLAELDDYNQKQETGHGSNVIGWDEIIIKAKQDSKSS